jgi:hypothetical protein
MSRRLGLARRPGLTFARRVSIAAERGTAFASATRQLPSTGRRGSFAHVAGRSCRVVAVRVSSPGFLAVVFDAVAGVREVVSPTIASVSCTAFPGVEAG